MKKALILLLAFAVFGFAAEADINGDVLLNSPYKVNAMAAVAAGIEGFDVGTKGSTEIIRDLWVGSDFDQDGNKEVMLASYSSTGRAYVYEIDNDNNATPFFDTGELGGSGGTAVRHVAFGDLDGNGMQELLVSLNSSTNTIAGIWAYEYDTAGDSMRAPVQLFNETVVGDRWYVENFTVGDADGDGVEEVIWGNNGSASTFDNFYIASVASGTFAEDNIVTKVEFTHGKSSATFPAGGSPYGGVLGDMDGDGNLEILFAPWDNGALFIVEAGGADTYTALNYIEVDLDIRDDFAFYDFVANDLDNDGRDEAYLSMYDGGRLYVVTCPSGTELSALTTANVHTIDDLGTSGGVCTQMGDLDRNGKMNIYASGGGAYLTNHEFIGTDPTDSTHWVKLDNITSASFSGVYGMRYAADLDGDGADEIFGANTGTSTVACAAVEIPLPEPPAVFFSEYIEGSSYNKALEIYNGTDETINLNDFAYPNASNGSDGTYEYWNTFTADATLAPGEVWVIADSRADAAILAVADQTNNYLSNGDDGFALAYVEGSDTLYLDWIGDFGIDVGTAWTVAGVANATQNHTLVRKEEVVEGNLWANSVGTNEDDSEWIVYPEDTFDYLGEHPTEVVLDPNYYIPKGSHDNGFATLKDAVDYFNTATITEPVVILLDADTLREASFTFAADLSETINMTIKPAEGRDVVLIVEPGASQGNGPQMIGFDKGYVTFDGSNDGTDSRNLLITNEVYADVPIGLNTADADNVTLKNLIIKNLDNGLKNFKYGPVTNDVAGIENFVVENCQVGSAEFPVWRDGVAVWGSGAGPTQGIVLNNEIYSGCRGIATYVVNDCVFNGNTIYMMPTISATTYSYVHGIYLTGASGPTLIQNNKIYATEAASVSGSYIIGIAFAGNSEGVGEIIHVTNNMINVGATAGTHPTYGIGFRSANNMGNIQAYHNTILMNDLAATVPCHAIGNHTTGTGPITLDLKNNIVINNHSGNTGSSTISLTPSTTTLNSDNNVLVANQNLVNLKGTLYADLAAWQATGEDGGSVSKAVTFTGTDDLHLATPSDADLDLVMPAMGITKDIDGDARGTFFAYAGADEGTAYPASNDLNLTFDDASDVTNWSHYDEENVYTVEAQNNGMLVLSDAGFDMLAKRPVSATVGSIYKLTIDIKTSLWEGEDNVLELSVQGLGADQVTYSCINDTDWVTYNIIGIAEATDGYIRIGGAKAGSVDTVFVDNVIWDDQYREIAPSASITDAKSVALGDDVACSGVVTAITMGAPIFMQDEDAGIALYDWDFIDDEIVEEGDEILVIGTRAEYNGLQQISYTDEDYVVLSKGNPVVPALITVPDLDSRAYQGMLVMVEDVDTVAGFSWPAEGSDKSITLKDESDNQFTLRIDKDSEIDGSEPPKYWPLDLVGVVSEFYSPQIMPRYMDDFIVNQAPGPFTVLNPVDGDTISTVDDPAFVDYAIGMDTVKAMLVNWEKAVDEAADTVTYELIVSPDGPEEAMITQDTVFYIPINENNPYEMNGTYELYVVATDLLGEFTHSDTVTVTFDFPAPPRLVNSDIVLVDGTPAYYAEFDLELEAAAIANFSMVDVSDGNAAITVTAVDSIAPNAVLVSGDLPEDHLVSLAHTGLKTPGVDLSKDETTEAQKVYIPFSDAHPEDAPNMIEDFETNVGTFNQPYISGQSTVLNTSTFAVSDEEAFYGTKSGKLILNDDPATSGGWYVREYYALSKSVKATSTIMVAVKGSNANVEMRLSVKDTGYEQGPWQKVTLSEDDWQIVSFDLVNDPAEGWVNGNGAIEGSAVQIEGIHFRCSEDADVVLYLDGFVERKALAPVDVTLNVMMHEWLRQGKFNLATDFVDVVGTFNDWDGSSSALSDFDTDTTYSITVPMMPYSTQNFKFRINGSESSSTIEFPDGSDRELVVPERGGEFDYWYNDDTLEVAIDGIPTEFALHQNYPNPFNPTTTINFDLPQVADVKLVIYDITGRKVRTLVNDNSVAAGYKKIVWNGRDDFGNGVSTGMYIYRLTTGDFVDVKKMTFLK